MREYIVSVDDDQKDFEEIFIGNVRDGDELVRCKDCKHYTGKWCTKFSTKQFDIKDICKSDDDFCSMAERKRGNNYETNR